MSAVACSGACAPRGRLARRAGWLAACALVAVACGARTELREGDAAILVVDAQVPDVHLADAHVVDAASDASVAACNLDGDPSPSATASYGACGEAVNIASAPEDNCAGSGAAFEYVPSVDVVIDRIELHTDAATVGLLDSDPSCDLPGATLFIAQLDTSGPTLAWRGVEVQPPITVKASHKYFVWQAAANGNDATACSAASSGVSVREYTAPGANGPWAGPFGGIAWTARLDGVCP